MLTDNIIVSDRLVNGSGGTVKYLDMRPKAFCSTIFVKFDDPKVGNSLKDERLCSELKEFVSITARMTRFHLKKGTSIVTDKRKHFPIMLGHAFIVQKSQGSTLNYIKGDLSRFTG